MTKSQTSLYWRSWAAAKKAARLEESDRHDIHIQTLGADKSSRDLTNTDLDKLLATFRALAAPDDLHTQIDKQNQPRKRILWWIRNNCYDQYAAALARDKFGTEAWDTLPFDKLQQLHMTLKNRPKSQTPLAASLAPQRGEGQGDGCSPINISHSPEPEPCAP